MGVIRKKTNKTTISPRMLAETIRLTDGPADCTSLKREYEHDLVQVLFCVEQCLRCHSTVSEFEVTVKK